MFVRKMLVLGFFFNFYNKIKNQKYQVTYFTMYAKCDDCTKKSFYVQQNECPNLLIITKEIDSIPQSDIRSLNCRIYSSTSRLTIFTIFQNNS